MGQQLQLTPLPETVKKKKKKIKIRLMYVQ